MERAPILKKLSRWVPKRWDTIHEQMVALSIRGLSNAAIAQQLGYTPVQVSRVLNTPQAAELFAQYKASLRKSLLEASETKIDTLQAQAMDNIEKVLTDRELQSAAPFQMLRASMDFMKGVGKLVGDVKVPSGGVTNNNTSTVNVLAMPNLPPDALHKLIVGASKAIEVMQNDLKIEVKEK